MTGSPRWLIVRREFTERVRSRAFRVGLAVQVGLIGVVLVITALTGSDGETRTVGLVGGASQAYAAPLHASGPSLDADVKTKVLASRAAALRGVRDGDLDAALVDGREILVKHDPDSTVAAVVQATRRQLALRGALERAGVPPSQMRAALDPPVLRVRAIEPQPSDYDTRHGLAFVALLLLYIAIITYGMVVAGGVVEEKSSRVIEVVLSAITPRELLFGKIVGIGAVAIATFIFTVSLGLLGATAIGTVDLPTVTAGAGILLIAWFVAGFLLYACLYSIAGALVSRSEDLQSSTGALNMIAVVSYLVGLIALSSPDSTLTTVASFVPLSAPMVMPVRWLTASVPTWQLVAAFALTFASSAALVRVSAAVYANTALRLGPRVSLRSALATRRA